jgi:hypothetical protein
MVKYHSTANKTYLDDVIDDSIVREIEKESVIERLYR